jgi:hypothetical protein
VPPSAPLRPCPTSSPPVAEPTCPGPTRARLCHHLYKPSSLAAKILLLPPLSLTLKLLCSSAAAAHHLLAGVLAHCSSILSAQRIPLSSRCFCPQFCSSSTPPPTSTTDLGAAVRHPPVRAHLRAAHRRWICLMVVSCLPCACAASRTICRLFHRGRESLPRRRRLLPPHRLPHQ